LLAEPRTTRDIDVTVVVASDREAERIALAFRHRGYRYLPESVLEQTAVHRLATVRFVSPAPTTGETIVDLLFASSGIRRYAEDRDLKAARESLELISRRGYDRGKDLLAEFARLV
jgi:hypothetical protein